MSCPNMAEVKLEMHVVMVKKEEEELWVPHVRWWAIAPDGTNQTVLCIKLQACKTPEEFEKALKIAQLELNKALEKGVTGEPVCCKVHFNKTMS